MNKTKNRLSVFLFGGARRPQIAALATLVGSVVFIFLIIDFCSSTSEKKSNESNSYPPFSIFRKTSTHGHRKVFWGITNTTEEPLIIRGFNYEVQRLS